jgi:MraZ protein
MPEQQEIILGEFQCTLDARYRVSVPGELSRLLKIPSPQCTLAKERPGCISLWNSQVWRAKVDVRVDLAKQKVRAGMHDDNIGHVQLLGRLLSTRHENVELDAKDRLLIPKSFREFLGVLPGKQRGGLMVVGAAICVEIWDSEAWIEYLRRRMPSFRKLVNKLA